MANDLLNNKLLIIKGILAEKCGLHPDLYDELTELIDDVRILSDAKDGALAKLSNEIAALPLQSVIASLCGWWQAKSIWCRIGLHRYKGSGKRVGDTYGTGKYIGDTEITEKRHFYIHRCIRDNCSHDWDTDWIRD